MVNMKRFFPIMGSIDEFLVATQGNVSIHVQQINYRTVLSLTFDNQAYR